MALKINRGMQVLYKIIPISGMSETPTDNFWFGSSSFDFQHQVMASATQGNVLIELTIDYPSSMKPEDLEGLAVMLIINQEKRLKDGGY